MPFYSLVRCAVTISGIKSDCRIFVYFFFCQQFFQSLQHLVLRRIRMKKEVIEVLGRALRLGVLLKIHHIDL